jgi:hypothetical protein
MKDEIGTSIYTTDISTGTITVLQFFFPICICIIVRAMRILFIFWFSAFNVLLSYCCVSRNQFSVSNCSDDSILSISLCDFFNTLLAFAITLSKEVLLLLLLKNKFLFQSNMDKSSHIEDRNDDLNL